MLSVMCPSPYILHEQSKAHSSDHFDDEDEWKSEQTVSETKNII